jgi:nucleoid DNA-binding protein
MYNLIDIVQLKTGEKRETVEKILNSLSVHMIEYLKEGHDIYWVGLCKLTWKQKAKTKKQAKEWTEYPYLAEGDKLRCLPLPGLEELDIKGPIMKVSKGEDDGEVQVVEAQEDK